jgi:hypothetical protein
MHGLTAQRELQPSSSPFIGQWNYARKNDSARAADTPARDDRTQFCVCHLADVPAALFAYSEGRGRLWT